MATKFIVDTHALIWYFEGNSLLGLSAKSVMSDPASELVLPAIALAEAIFIVEKGRCSITGVEDLLSDLKSDDRFDIYPLMSGILEDCVTLQQIPEIHDRLIVATGVYLQHLGESVEILTKDTIITASGVLPVRW